MNHLGREFSVPQEKVQNGEFWIPSTPEKPFLGREKNHMGQENWQDLIGIYSGVLQEETSNGVSVEFNQTGGVRPHQVERYTSVPQNFRPNILFQEVGPITGIVGLNNRENNRFDGALVEKLRRFNENGRSIGPYLPNLGGGGHLEKVNSLAELMSTRSIPDAHSQVGSNNWKSYSPDGVILQQNCILGANQGVGDCSLQQMPKSRHSVPYRPSYNLNLPPRLEAGESSSATTASPFQIAPVTPAQQQQLKNNQSIQIPPLLIDDISNEKTNKQDNVLPPQPQHELVVIDHTLDASAAISTTPTGKQNFDCTNGGEIDLNKTPPQKTPKRRKHRPKVIVEGKAKRAPKAATPKKTTPNGNSATKRKYVHKKGIATSTNQSTDAATEVEVSILESQAKSCKRALNFDLENGVEKKTKGREFDYQEQNNGVSNLSVDLNLDPRNTELNGQSTSAVKEVHRNIYGKEKETENLYNFIHSANKIPSQESMPIAAMASPTTSKDHTLNVIARCLNGQNNNMNQNRGQSTYGQAHRCISGGLAQLVAQANTIVQNRDGRRQPKHQTRPQLLQHFVDCNERKEPYSRAEPIQPLIVSDLSSHGVSNTGHYNREIRKLWQNGLESSMAIKVNENIHGPSSSMPSGNTTVGTCSKQIESTGNKSFHAQRYGLYMNGRVPYSGREGKSSSINPTNEASTITCHPYMNSTYSGHSFQKQESLNAEQMEHMTSHHLAIVPTTSSLNKIADLLPPSSREPKFTQGNDIIDTPARLSAKRQAAGQTSSNKISSMDKVRRKDTKSLHSKKVKGSRDDRRNIFSVDDITDRMKDLQLNNNGKEIDREERNALVPYRGDGTLVPFDPVKRRKPRPKVDLDPETNRLWNLLMGKEGSENAETDNNKQKWWEEERKVFRGRVDSFIARMHLVQGDRRFSKWKGSVVDSVIGVFLTQNVSDHLSSSAFMCLAAKYPKKTTISETCCPAEHEILVTFPDGSTDDHRMIKEPAYDSSCVTSIELSECGAENVTPGRNSLINNHTRRTEEVVISSQSSPESTIFQASEDIRSSSGSNSEAEDQIIGSNLRTNLDPLNLFEKSEKNAVFQQYLFQEMGSSSQEKRPSIGDQQYKNPAYRQNSELGSGKNAYADPFTTNMPHNQTPVLSPTSARQNLPTGPEKWKVDVLALLGKEGTSSLSSTEFAIRNGKGIQHGHDIAGQTSESSLTAQQTERYKLQPSITNHQTPNKHLEQQTVPPAVPKSRNDPHRINYRQGEMQKTIQQENSFPKNSIRPFEAFNEQPTDIREQSGNTTLERSQMKKVPPNDRKRKAEKEKAEPFNWDTLRKQVQSKAGRGRSRNAMDSLDYEALRNADVREISNTIKERGMNNMLAERMKDFLNRLVRDHGATDLEWLRDVQPDKAKDYLLSIRGLGLKSVECVRLLTLHHLAFPVDTNVGRIAVRLGWVPLQPLPESLQLHLLELYPVLESIQKYLWPRLCMLDQETLYELHYQMITFGKVFCTKREPNCNACPMRGECRHFASAFASARLALPGPEEKRVVSAAAPSYSKSCGFDTNPMSLPPAVDNFGRGTEFRRNCEPSGTSCIKSSGMVINPMPLTQAEDNLGRGTQFTRNSEPIIEEPSTPESPVEMSERDIEDAFYEDPDEIPVIKLNIEEFTTNLQTFMQEKLDLQEGDMSKALVALSPEVASIPVPKLKHISRLRTEHQVYELPDSHPLLQGMDRREPDDPSPYLLALWTPGETEDSVQPPESKCTSHEGGLCNGKTCFSCNSTREAQAQTVRGTILIPCRTAMRGSFPLNGTYFQVNEVFADHESSMNPIDVPRSLIWNLPRRTVFFGTSVTSIFKGLSTEGIQYCFWRGFVCVRGFEQKTRAPRPLRARLHLPASKIAKQKE